MDKDKEIKTALSVCGGSYKGVAFDNILGVYVACLRELPCTTRHLSMEIQADIGLSERKASEKIKVLLHRNILVKGKDNLVFWYTDKNNGNQENDGK